MARAWICPDCGFKFAWGDGEYPGHWVYTHIDLAHPKEKENNMEEQMEQVWRSKDGKVTGSKEEVEAYLKGRSPLARMRFPYKSANGWAEPSGSTIAITGGEHRAFVAFANLAPLIQEVLKEWENEWRGDDWRGSIFTERWHNELANLLLAYEEALKQVPQ